jgi:hypothetical protein
VWEVRECGKVHKRGKACAFGVLCREVSTQLHSANDQWTARVNMAFSHPQNYDSLQQGPGYTLGLFQECDTGLTAQLALSGLACNAFGLDISDLTIKVTYQSQSMYIVSRTCLMPH